MIKKEKERKKNNRKNAKASDILERQAKKTLRNRETNIISFIFAALFLLMIGYLIYFNVNVADKVIDNPYNKRIDLCAEKIHRGSILASDYTELAVTVVDEEGNDKRVYPFGRQFCHVLGIPGEKTGIEGSENYQMLSKGNDIILDITNSISGQKAWGNNCVTTLDVNLQKLAYEAIGEDRGAVVVMEPSTGKILAMVSKPDYDPNEADAYYDEWLKLDKSESVLLNRATQGLYAPGSTFKIITALAYVRENSDYDSFYYKCNGSVTVEEGTTIPCIDNTVHGEEDLYTAFANSCNCAFSTIGLSLKKNSLKDICSSLGFNSELPLKLAHSKSSFVLNEKSEISEIQGTAIGQGKTMISPIHNLMITCAIANGGVMMRPYLLDHIEDVNGNIVKSTKPTAYSKAISEKEADVLTECMYSVTTVGTASVFANTSYRFAAKTGLAQYGDSSDSHAWIVGFAPYDDPQIAICVVLEGGYQAADGARQVAKYILDRYFGDV